MSSLVCVQVWVVCLSADGRPYSGAWLLCVCVFVLVFMLFVVVCLFGCSLFLFLSVFFLWAICAFVCSVSVLSSSGVTPAVSPVWRRAGGTAAAVPAVTACRRERVLLTLCAQTVSQPSSSSITCWLTAAG